MAIANINNGEVGSSVRQKLNDVINIVNNPSIDVFVSGGTYNNSNGTATFTNTTGGTFNVAGFFTGSTDIFTTGGTYDVNTGVATFTRNDGNTYTTSGFYTGYTLTSTEITNALGYTPISADTNTFVTGFTFDPLTYQLDLNQNDNSNFNVDLSVLADDVFITGGTYFTGGTLELTNNLGASILVTGLTEDLNSEIAGLAEPDEKTITLNLTTNEIELKDVVQAPTGGTRTFEGNIVLQDGDFTTNTGYIDVMNGRTTLGLYDATSSTNEAILRFDNNGSDAYFILSEVTKPSSDITNTLIVGDDGMTGREMFLQVRNSGTGEQSNIGINADKITISTDITSTSSGCNIQVTNDSLAFETLSGDTMIMSA
jgi:hypothetical protein